ncbi:MAG TPA: RNA polymerase factor sigma-54, partial [Microvirga sp.]|nr:RNA polymerase factor sigma-54 [Microvirga sp.]
MAKLQLRQTQSLVITPQLMQAIRLLQMSGVELERFVADAIEQNPLLAQSDETEKLAGEPLPEAAVDSAGDPSMEACAELDAEPADAFPEQGAADNSGRGSLDARASRSSDWDDLTLDATLPASDSLAEVLERGIETAFGHAPADRLIAHALLGCLDEAGYLTSSPAEVADHLGALPAAVERVLKGCQEIAPTGMFARSLSECLALQLAERNRLDPAMQALLDNLERLAARDRAGLCALCGVDSSDLDDMIGEIRALNPKPGLAYANAPVRTLIPDVFVRPGPDGGWTVELNDAALPRLIVDRTYYTQVSARAGEADRKYLSDCLQKASWLEKSLDQRARTVLRVASEVVRRQEGFLADGVAFLRPLNLRMVADALGIHESTVSRAAANKTIATPRGIFEFRYF